MLIGTVLDELERRNQTDRSHHACASAAAWASRPSSSASEDGGGRRRATDCRAGRSFFPSGGHVLRLLLRQSLPGLRLRFFRDADGVRCETTIAPAFQGRPTVVHGGIQAVVLDETCCAAAFFTTAADSW